MKSTIKLLALSILVVAFTNTKSSAYVQSSNIETALINDDIAQVTASKDAKNNYIMKFSLRKGKSWTQSEFALKCGRWLAPTIANGPLLDCSFDRETQTITAVFDGASMAKGADSTYMNSFFKRFGYHQGYTIL